ncbi:hypothetical protein DAEQUDRAFT_27665 [Daedalea quercina L-15889]|uniref:Uncharacterized protein n=1 Tax=Daedalea quercina L-15889 TaxID=1314783 RepID=A0A165SNX7_9APHY|nr:hypothetical protein DAEQUDRAFT_27665 [Daedalea quercina L-15889]
MSSWRLRDTSEAHRKPQVERSASLLLGLHNRWVPLTSLVLSNPTVKMEEEAFFTFIDDVCKQVVSYFNTFCMLCKKDPTQAQLCEHFVVAVAELASSRQGLRWRESIQVHLILDSAVWWHQCRISWLPPLAKVWSQAWHFCFNMRTMETLSTEFQGKYSPIRRVDCISTRMGGVDPAACCRDTTVRQSGYTEAENDLSRVRSRSYLLPRCYRH